MKGGGAFDLLSYQNCIHHSIQTLLFKRDLPGKK